MDTTLIKSTFKKMDDHGTFGELSLEDRALSLEERALTLPEQAKTLVINNSADYIAAGEYIKQLDALLLEIDAGYDDNILAAHKLHKGLIEKKRKYARDPILARTTVRHLMMAWDNEQELRRYVLERHLREDARKIEEEVKLQEALSCEAAGHQEEAQAIIEEEVYVPPIILQKTTPKIQGVRFQTIWKWRLKDIKKVPPEYFMLDEVKIGGVVRAKKEAGEIIPGIEAYWEKI